MSATSIRTWVLITYARKYGLAQAWKFAELALEIFTDFLFLIDFDGYRVDQVEIMFVE